MRVTCADLSADRPLSERMAELQRRYDRFTAHDACEVPDAEC